MQFANRLADIAINKGVPLKSALPRLVLYRIKQAMTIVTKTAMITKIDLFRALLHESKIAAIPVSSVPKSS